ncbi:MAG: DinB family protein [Bacteroidetes bacterium]|nr:DinB family protein [Bacteroidota bacterium]MBU1372782.1 DinB family protein [Bacteroidota bacterium]MBU1484978.1 DinB family protein [Bacteroidota bacterium]MBU1761817.1 DinB family protein [Bacteroidota bacterium]MBU2268717.1 DinB family protein [Bacteroidota bacterium]
MKKQFEINRTTRKTLLAYIEGLSSEQLNRIPAGFNNNIIWNLAHMIAAQQGVCYKRGGHPMLIDEAAFENFKPGTVPPLFVDDEQINQYKDLFLSTIDQWEKDYNDNLFAQNPSWRQSMGIDMNTIEESINFLLWHDGVHGGIIMSLKKLV